MGALRRLDVSNKLLSRPPNAARALTNEFLPGQGLADAGTGVSDSPAGESIAPGRSRRYGPRP